MLPGIIRFITPKRQNCLLSSYNRTLTSRMKLNGSYQVKELFSNYFLATHMHVYQCSASVLNIHHDDITIIFMALHLLYRSSAPLL